MLEYKISTDAARRFFSLSAFARDAHVSLASLCAVSFGGMFWSETRRTKIRRRQVRRAIRIIAAAAAAAPLLLGLIFFAATVCAAPGDLDPSFGANGTVVTDLPGDNFTKQVEVRSDGKILVLGKSSSTQGNVDTYLVRYHADGLLDTGFGVGGVLYARSIGGVFGEGFVVLPDGKLLVAGAAFDNGYANAAVFRLNPDGSPDANWGVNGIVKTRLTGYAGGGNEIIVKPDGKILIFVSGGYLIRYHPDGTPDASFGTNGVSIIANPGGNSGAGVVIRQVEAQVEGKTLFLIRDPFSPQNTFIGRLNANDTLDLNFGFNGFIQIFTESVSGDAFALQPDGKIVVTTKESVVRGSTAITVSTVARYTVNGFYDYSFGTYGRVTFAPAGGMFFEMTAIAAERNGRIVVGGTKVTSASRTFVVFRLNRNGAIDRTFGADGMTTAVLRGVDDFLTALTFQTDGNLVALGDIAASLAEPYDIGLARFLVNSRAQPAAFDFDGDNRSDISVFRPAGGIWRYLNILNNTIPEQSWGLPTDTITPADYDGDGKTDLAVFRAGVWYWISSLNGRYSVVQFGRSGDTPVPADYDGDASADLAVFRDGFWYIRRSTDGRVMRLKFGAPADQPVVGDYDGDRSSDAAVYRDGAWQVFGSANGFFGVRFGLASDRPAAADFDGDGRTDFAVYRPSEGTWYLLQSEAGFAAVRFGAAEDTPVAADYDGDGRADIAVYRASEGNWYILQSSGAGVRTVNFGSSGDLPVPAAYAPQ